MGQGRRTLLQALVGEAQVWLGDLAAGEEHLSAAAHGARAEGSVQLASEVLAGLALAEYSRGRMADAARLARTAEATRGSDGRTPACVRSLAALHADPWHPPDDGAWADPGPHLLARFWGDLAAATVPALRGRTRPALAALGAPVELPELPAPLAAARDTVRALVAAAADDLAELRGARSRLAEHGAAAGVRFVDGVLAVLRRDLRTALEAFRAAGDDPDAAPQPDVATLTLVCAAQVAEGRGDETGAARLLGAATERAEPRRDALAFVGWLGHVPPVHAVLARVRPPAGSWSAGVLATARDAGSLHALVARTTPTANEARRAGRPVAPPLTQREREVLERLARGASYADIAADLVLSADTVKTHVASLYAKLGAGRRSDALATARTYDLL
ncbi:MAG: helix-turn-helix transcriptional regulator [Actinomycetales bacterium]|nr:helix-turn-helix transcriptional regulator [Actinomycetales bacterium]